MRFFTVSEAAQILRVTPKSVRDYILSGQLKASKIGTWKISEEDLMEFIASRANVATNELDSDSLPVEPGTVKAQLIIDYYTDNPTPLVSETTEFINENEFKDASWEYTYDVNLKRARFRASGDLKFLKAVIDIASKYAHD